MAFDFTMVPEGTRLRWFVRYGAVTKFNRGFRTKAEINNWISHLGYAVDWRAGYVLRLKGDAQDIHIVDRVGHAPNN